MLLTNQQIYSYATNLANEEFYNVALPVKISFYLIKNKKLLMELAQEIDKGREQILNQYGTLSEDKTQYIINSAQSEQAQTAMNELFNLSQEVQIYTVPLDTFGCESLLTPAQMEALMFMIEE